MPDNATTNPPGSTQLPSGRVVSGPPVHDSSRGHLMPAGYESDSAPDHLATRRGQAGHQRR
jgi:hypothetical protein